MATVKPLHKVRDRWRAPNSRPTGLELAHSVPEFGFVTLARLCVVD